MKYLIIILMIIPSLTGCEFLKKNKEKQVIVKVLNYGRSYSKLLYTSKDDRMPSGQKRTTDYKLNVLEKTDTIKLTKDVQFGIEYIIESPTTELITIRTEWTYPKIMINHIGKEYKKVSYEIDKYSNQETYSNYTLEEDYEMISGEWNLKLFHKNRVILNKNFYLLK